MAAVRRVYVHIGPPKTGTTFIQGVLRRNSGQLDAEGCVLPRGQRQHGAVLHLLGRAERVGPDGWDRLVDETRGADAGRAIVSVEGLSRASADQVAALVESFSPATVHVVYGTRDLTRLVPAFWQSRLRNRDAPSWLELVASVRAAAHDGLATDGLATDDLAGEQTYGERFWSQFDPRRALAPWLEHLPVQRVHVLTVPPTGAAPALLWQRFCAVVGLRADRYDLRVPRVNRSLGGAEAEVLRRITAQVGETLPPAAYADLVKKFVAREVLERRPQSYPLVLAATDLAWLAPRADAAIDYLRRTGFPIVGDLRDLVPVVEPGGRAPDDVDEAAVLALMDEVLAETVLEMARRAFSAAG